jgi:hypothetical protein
VECYRSKGLGSCCVAQIGWDPDLRLRKCGGKGDKCVMTAVCVSVTLCDFGDRIQQLLGQGGRMRVAGCCHF